METDWLYIAGLVIGVVAILWSNWIIFKKTLRKVGEFLVFLMDALEDNKFTEAEWAELLVRSKGIKDSIIKLTGASLGGASKGVAVFSLFTIFSSILKLLRGMPKPNDSLTPLPTIRRETTLDALHRLLTQKFPDATILNPTNVYLSDTVKSLCDISDIEAFLKQDKTNHFEYKNQAFDCDDFTFRLMGQFSTPEWAPIAKGIVWTDTHALMCFIDSNLDFWWIEPQTDNVNSKLEPWQGSRIRFILM